MLTAEEARLIYNKKKEEEAIDLLKQFDGFIKFAEKEIEKAIKAKPAQKYAMVLIKDFNKSLYGKEVPQEVVDYFLNLGYKIEVRESYNLLIGKYLWVEW